MPIINDLEGIFQNLIISAAFLMLLLAILTYVGSGGEAKRVTKAKEFLLSAVTALVALVLVKMFLGGSSTENIQPAQFSINPLDSIDMITSAIHRGGTDAMGIFGVATTILTGITGLILEIIPIFAILMTMYAGIQYIFSAGDPKKSETAVKLLNSSVTGFAIFLMLYALWYFIRKFIGA